MLFTYKYIKHDIEKFQELLDFLFYEVWLVADGDFDAEKLNGNPELKQLYVDFDSLDLKWGDFFNRSIESIYIEFTKIDPTFKNELKEFYASNNSIEVLCNDKTKIPISYEQIHAKYPDLEKALKDFYSKLYGTDSPFNLKAFGQLNSEIIPSHYESFMNINIEGVCPFCGILPIKGNNHSFREAYDHYLPKGLYPFNAMNFSNLAPMCHECNSTYKLKDDPIYEDYKKIDPLNKEDLRQLAFYPYSVNHPELDITIELYSKNIEKLKPIDINLTIKSPGNEEQIDSWKRVFGIEERYKALICQKYGANDWFTSIVDEFDNFKEIGTVSDYDKWIEMKIRVAGRNKLANYGFLKVQFLQECKAKGLFDRSAS